MFVCGRLARHSHGLGRPTTPGFCVFCKREEKNKDKYKRIGVNARKTIVDNFDLNKKCLPAQLDLVTKALK